MRGLARYIGVAGLAAVATAQQARFEGIGDLPGGVFYSLALNVSDDGQTLVGHSSSFDSYWGETARWTSDGGLEGLGMLPGHDQSTAFGVSSRGDWVVGESVLPNEYVEAFAWSRDTGMFSLGDLPGGRYRSTALGVSRNGAVIVGSSSSGNATNNGSEAFRWTPQHGMTGLGFLGGDSRRASTAYSVSADGSVIVGASTSDAGSQAFKWTADTGMVGLGALDDSDFSSGAYAVSANGDWVVGESTISDDNGFGHIEAVRWDPSGQIEGLGWFGMDSGNRYSFANDVSDDGRTVVGRAYAQDSQWNSEQAFLWSPEDGMRPIVDVLLDYGIDVEAEGWRLTSAAGVSADGLTIVGIGYVIGQGSQGWIVHLPSPAGATLLAAAGLVACRRRR
jgi:probable HAF family extracellular repeat protein